MIHDTRKQIESKYFDGEYEEMPEKEKLNIVGYELLRLEDEIEELKDKQRELDLLYDIIKGDLK